MLARYYFGSHIRSNKMESHRDFLNATINICVIWWSAGTAFSATILGAAWRYRKEMEKEVPALDWLCGLIQFFYLSLVTFGAWVIYVSERSKDLIARDVTDLALEADRNALYFEFFALQIGMVIGTSSFVLIAVSWIGLWRYFRKRKYGKSSSAAETHSQSQPHSSQAALKTEEDAQRRDEKEQPT